jgi:hypothetical protein
LARRSLAAAQLKDSLPRESADDPPGRLQTMTMRLQATRDAVKTVRPAVCTENSIRVDYVTESPNVSGDVRSVLPLPDPFRLAVQVEEPT